MPDELPPEGEPKQLDMTSSSRLLPTPSSRPLPHFCMLARCLKDGPAASSFPRPPPLTLSPPIYIHYPTMRPSVAILSLFAFVATEAYAVVYSECASLGLVGNEMAADVLSLGPSLMTQVNEADCNVGIELLEAGAYLADRLRW